jgi:serine beta-lactamase-like protein LACTB, mitochondrial
VEGPILKYFKNLFARRHVSSNGVQVAVKKRADVLLQSLLDEKKIPGLAITVLKKGELLFQKGYGFSDLENKIKVNPKKTIFRIASISKNIAATALAHMVKDGLIDLDNSLYDYVPYFPKKRYDFTIRQLASHTAGIRGYRGTEYALNKRYSIKESLEIFKNDELVFEPGTNFHYNSFDILGHAGSKWSFF